MNFSGVSNKGVIGRLLRLPLKLIPDKAVVPILQGPLQGKRWIAGSSSHGCWLGSYEFSKQKIFIEHVSEGQIVYDIGAHVGFYTLLSSQLVGTTGQVIAFEPFPPNVAYIQRHIILNDLKNVKLIQKAVSNRYDQVTFQIANSSSMGHLAEGKISGDSIIVDTIALDQFISDEGLPLPDVVKVDIEGAEFDFLQGARNLFESRSIKLFLATHGSDVHSSCVTFLQEMGYEVVSLEDKPLHLSSEIFAAKPNLR